MQVTIAFKDFFCFTCSMSKTIFAIFFTFSVFAQSLSLSNNGYLTIFPIAPSSRGADIVSMFTTLNTGSFNTVQSQIAIQTTNNGLIPNIQFITPMTNFTILVIGYLLPGNEIPIGNNGGSGAATLRRRFGYVAIPVEQIVEMIYSPTTIPVTNVYTAPAVQGTLPIFSVDMAQRTADLIQAVTLLITPPIANANSAVTPVSLLTTLNGPYYVGNAGGTGSSIIINGVIPQVAAVATVPNSTLLLVTFKPIKTNQYVASGGFATIVVAPEQISGIAFTQN